jgi:ATP-dependent Clp protease adaptor protein ClpS
MGIKDPMEQEGGVKTDTRTEKKLARPRLYKVLLHNDDYTTMEFVVALLEHVFHHSEATATAIMLHIHQHGIGVAGVFTHEIAETKVAQVMELAQRAEFPLQCTLEPDDAPGEERPE